MRIYYLTFLFVLSCYCSSCIRNKQMTIESDFTISTKLIAKDSINLEEKGLLLPYAIWNFDSCFVFGNIRSENHISILNKKTNKVTNTAYVGNGPNEIIQLIHVGTNRNQFLFADRVKAKIYELELSEDYLHKEIYQFPDTFTHKLFSLTELDEEHFIGTGAFEKGRFVIYNKKDNSYKFTGKYPEDESTSLLTPSQTYMMYSGTLIGKNPSNNKFIAVKAGVMEFYTILKNNDLKLTMKRYYHFPLFNIVGDRGLVVYKKENVNGFQSLSYDSSYIYLLYCNSTKADKGADAFCGNIILVYDWDGNPIKRYDLEHYLRSIDMKNNTLWGVNDNHNYLYKYEL